MVKRLCKILRLNLLIDLIANPIVMGRKISGSVLKSKGKFYRLYKLIKARWMKNDLQAGSVHILK